MSNVVVFIFKYVTQFIIRRAHLKITVVPKTLARTSTTGSTTSLVRIGLTDWINLQCVHTDSRIINFHFTVASINNKLNSINCTNQRNKSLTILCSLYNIDM